MNDQLQALEAEISAVLTGDAAPVRLFSDAMNTAYNTVDDHYNILEHNIRSMAEDLVKRSKNLYSIADAVAQRREQIKAEISSANDFEEHSVKRVHQVRELVARMDAVFKS